MEAVREPPILRREWRILAAGAMVFVLVFALPVGWPRFDSAIHEALALTRWYAQEHFLLCLVPAFLIAGAIAVFVSQAAVMKYLGPAAPKPVAYAMGAVSGSILAVCSCTILPLFGSIWRRGAGLGPAIAFLYSGPAINVLAVVLTATVLGAELGIARAVGAIGFSVVIGFAMHVIYRKEELARARGPLLLPPDNPARPLWQTVSYFAALVGVLVFANWGRPQADAGPWFEIWQAKWLLTSLFGAALGLMMVRWFGIRGWKMALVALAVVTSWLALRTWLLPAYGRFFPGYADGLPWEAMLPFTVAVAGLIVISSAGDAPEEGREWIEQSWGFAKQITPLLLIGVLVAGFLLGRPGEQGLIPAHWIAELVGGNSLSANLFAALAGALMYFATLTEVPILQGLIGNGMGKGPALALLLAGPAVSLPNMLVIRAILGTRKTLVFVGLVVTLSTVCGFLYGRLA
jgi:uncharacterized membrane protein YraQ (UPF0718 family)